jgi:hypothetical protein
MIATIGVDAENFPHLDDDATADEKEASCEWENCF